jgi:hypothetical protein
MEFLPIVRNQLFITNLRLMWLKTCRACAFPGVVQGAVVGLPLSCVQPREADGNAMLARRGDLLRKQCWDTAIDVVPNHQMPLVEVLGRRGGNGSCALERTFVILTSGKWSLSWR